MLARPIPAFAASFAKVASATAAKKATTGRRVRIRVHSHLRQTKTANVAKVVITVNPMMYKNAAGS